MKTKHPVHVMVFGMVTSSGEIILPFIFLYCLQLNTLTYIKCLKEVVLLWIEMVGAGYKTLCRILQAGEYSLNCQKISATTLPQR